MSDNRKVGEGMKERIDRHKDGSIKAKGHMMDGELEGYGSGSGWMVANCAQATSKAENRSANGPPMTPLARS